MLPTITRRNFKPFYMSNFFDNDFFSATTSRPDSTPAVNIKEDEKSYSIELAIPGINKKDLKIDINEDVLTVSSETKNESKEENNGYKRMEFSYSSFARNFFIPENVTREAIDANYKDGVLFVSLPKQKEDKTKVSRQVAIS